MGQPILAAAAFQAALCAGWKRSKAGRPIFHCGSVEVESFNPRSDSVWSAEYTINGAIGPPVEPVHPMIVSVSAASSRCRSIGTS